MNKFQFIFVTIFLALFSFQTEIVAQTINETAFDYYYYQDGSQTFKRYDSLSTVIGFEYQGEDLIIHFSGEMYNFSDKVEVIDDNIALLYDYTDDDKNQYEPFNIMKYSKMLEFQLEDGGALQMYFATGELGTAMYAVYFAPTGGKPYFMLTYRYLMALTEIMEQSDNFETTITEK